MEYGKLVKTPEFIALCEQQLEVLSNSVNGVSAALLSTPDGFDIASKINVSSHSADKLAAVGSSMFALGASLVREFDFEDCKSINIDCGDGKVYLSAVPVNGTNSVLLIRADQKAMLANVMHGAKKISAEITGQAAIMAEGL